MAYYYAFNHRPSTAPATQSVGTHPELAYDPAIGPDAALVAGRQAKCPGYRLLANVPPVADYLVLDVPFGRKGSVEIRNWAKRIGARWNGANWCIAATLVDSDRLEVINQLCLYQSHYARPAPVYLARFGQDNCIVILQVPFEEKDTAKSAGARWDTSLRKWYFPMKGQIGVVAFSQKIAEFEEKGWVDTVATETFNARFLGCKNADLDRLRIAHRTAAEAGAFVNKIGSWGAGSTTPATAAAPAVKFPINSEEIRWINELLKRKDSTTEIADQWILQLIGHDGAKKWIRIQRMDGVTAAVRLSYSFAPPNGETPKWSHAKWTHHYYSQEESRLMWNEATSRLGYTVLDHCRYTGQQFAFIAAHGCQAKAGVFPVVNNILADEIAVILCRRGLGKSERLP